MKVAKILPFIACAIMMVGCNKPAGELVGATKSTNFKEANPYVLSDKILRLTCRGESVRWLQFELKRNGYELKVDGSFGLKTEAAVKKFQKDKKLTVDGIAGPKTIAALKEGSTQIISK